MDKLGMEYRVNSPHKSVEKLPDGSLIVNLENGDSIECDAVLNAMGRKPNLDGMLL